MPELPEVEVLVQHLMPLLRRRTIRAVTVRRAKVLAPTSTAKFRRMLQGATFFGLRRRGKYLVFDLRGKPGAAFSLLGHLGMTGRMYLAPAKMELPKYAAVVLQLGRDNFIYEDPRGFGRFTLDLSSVAGLGPEPLSDAFTIANFAVALQRSARPIKVKLLDQTVVAGVGNIYASEALFRAGISPRLGARRLSRTQVARLRRTIRQTLTEAIRHGSTIPLNYGGTGQRDGLFYFGRLSGGPDDYMERLQVYDRAGLPCRRCQTPIRRLVQAARSTFYCPQCQRG